MIDRVYADHVHQISRTHWQAPTFHDLIHLLKVSTFRDHNFQTKEHGKEHTIDQEARAVIDYNRLLTET